MIRIWLCVFVVLSFFRAPVSYAQTTVWLSDNATFSDLNITTAAPPGTTGSFDIWIKTEHSNRLYSIGLDLLTTGNAIEFTGADIVIGRNRFYVFETSVPDDGTVVKNMSAYAGVGLDFGSGIGGEVPVDDLVLDAYRFATIYYRIANVGTSDLQLKVGNFTFDWTLGGPNVLHLGIDDPMSVPYMPGDTDPIIDGRIRVVPEPNSLLLFLLGGLFLWLR
jgi:hypothetical protein